MINSDDFHTVEDLKFDPHHLQKALHQTWKIKDYDTAGGITNFGAISLNQIPGDPDSIKGNNTRGVYWTKPNHTGKEKSRDKIIDEKALKKEIPMIALFPNTPSSKKNKNGSEALNKNNLVCKALRLIKKNFN